MSCKFRLVALAFTFIVSCTIGVAQTAHDLKKYESLAPGRYQVREGIIMIVTFAKGGQAKKVVIQPLDSSADLASTSARRDGKQLSQGEVREIIDEVVPEAKRGRYITEISFVTGCASIATDVYEHVKISRALVCTSEGESLISLATITWQDR
ncbi:MAG: hypothetical protein ACRD9R_08295 [Pyrinomonadaceae bacterium]